MQTDESIIKLLNKLFESNKVQTSFGDGKITYNGESYNLSQTTSASGKRTTTLKFK